MHITGTTSTRGRQDVDSLAERRKISISVRAMVRAAALPTPGTAVRGGARVVRPVHIESCCGVALTKCDDDHVNRNAPGSAETPR